MKKIIAVAAAVCLLAGVAFATGSKDTGSAAKKPAFTGEGYLNNKEFKKVDLPLVPTKTTLTVWTNNDVTAINVAGGDMNNLPFYQELEKRTNVHIEWQIPASGSENEQQNLMWASGDLPDIIYYVNYTDGLDACIDDGFILDLKPYLAQYAPNYMAAINNANPDVKKRATTDAGRIPSFLYIMQEEQPPFLGYMVRKDWLDELGLALPVTYDDWENMLTQFKNKKGCRAPLSGMAAHLKELGAGFGFYGGFFGAEWYVENGKVKYPWVDNVEGSRKFFETMNRWYSKGLIDADIASSMGFFGDPVLVNNDQTGAFLSMYTYPATMFAAAIAKGAEFVAVLPPVQKKGEVVHYRIPNQLTGAAFVISQQCKNPELAVKWLDYNYSVEGALLCNYGVEGDTYTMVNGKPVFTDKMLHNEKLNFDECMRSLTAAPGRAGVYSDYKRELQSVPPQYVQMMYDWGETPSDMWYPDGAAMTMEENMEYSRIYADISTYIQEKYLGLITGSTPLSEFDSIVKKINDSGIKKCIELRQAAYDRYMAR